MPRFVAAEEFLRLPGRDRTSWVEVATGNWCAPGGWGPVMSDQGAGSRIGLLALRAMFHAHDASEETSLLPTIHAAWARRQLKI